MSSQYANELGGFKCQSPAGQRCWETANHTHGHTAVRKHDNMEDKLRKKQVSVKSRQGDRWFIPLLMSQWVCLCVADIKRHQNSLLMVLSCALDRISSYTVSLLKRHYSIDDVLSRVSFLLRLWRHTLGRGSRWLLTAGEGCQTVTITEFQ